MTTKFTRPMENHISFTGELTSTPEFKPTKSGESAKIELRWSNRSDKYPKSATRTFKTFAEEHIAIIKRLGIGSLVHVTAEYEDSSFQANGKNMSSKSSMIKELSVIPRPGSATTKAPPPPPPPPPPVSPEQEEFEGELPF